MKARLAVLALCGALILPLTACGGAPVTSPTPNPSATATPAVTPEIEACEDKELSITLEAWNSDSTASEVLERAGTYTGPLVNGKPEGKGRFDTQNSSNELWYYDGEFKNGTFNGQGACVWPESNRMQWGTYKNGLFVPSTPQEFFVSHATVAARPYSLSDTSISFLSDHPSFFPYDAANPVEDIRLFVDTSIEYKMLTKNITKYEASLISMTGLSVIQIFEATFWGNMTTEINAMDTQGNVLTIYYKGELPDVFEQSVINLIGLPVALSGYDNVSGGVTNTIIVLGCQIDCLES